MKLLLDTHVAIWAVEDSPRLSSAARALILRPEARIFVSVVSLWEIAIKHALGRSGERAMPMSAAVAKRYFLGSGFELLPIEPQHVEALEGLERHHDDPFDRLLVATARHEPMHLVTQDRMLASYGDAIRSV